MENKENQAQPARQVHQRNSRELMPPPLPRPRQPPPSMPTPNQPIEGPFAASTHTAALAPRDVIQVYTSGGWNDSQSTLPVSEHDYAPSGMSAQQHRLQSHGALPFRPLERLAPESRPTAHVERHDPYYVDDFDARYQMPPNSVPAPPHGLLSQAPRRPNQRQPYSQPKDCIKDTPPPAGQAWEGAQSPISYFNADYGTVARQSDGHAPRDVEGFHPESAQSRPSLPFAKPNSLTVHQSIARPPRSNPQPSAASVASPFFKSGPAARADTMQRPLARGTMAPPPLPRRSDIPRNSIGGPSVPPPRNSVAQPSCRNNAYDSQRHFPAPVSSQRQSSIAPSSLRAHSTATRYHSASQPTHQRAEMLTSEAGPYAPNRSASLSQRNRMELEPYQPPSTSRVPLGSLFDPQLSQIRGVRGANASQLTYSRHGLPSSRQPRSTYSAAGGRRSVLR